MNGVVKPSGDILNVIVPVAVPSASAVAYDTLVPVTAVTFWSPFNPLGVDPATTTVLPTTGAADPEKFIVATPPLTTRLVTDLLPKPAFRQASSTPAIAPAVPLSTGAEVMPLWKNLTLIFDPYGRSTSPRVRSEKL